MQVQHEHDRFILYRGKSEAGLADLADASCDALVTDPPSSIGFMGVSWDKDKGGRAQWVCWLSSVMREAYRLLKPGAHGLIWALPRRTHWTMLALEDAGFELRDIVHHVFAEGFPKSTDVSVKIDAKLGAERKVIGVKNKTYDGCVRDPSKHSNPAADASFGNWGLKKTPHGMPLTEPATEQAKRWDGWGTGLKPAVEHWILVRKPLAEEDVAANVLALGTGALNVKACCAPEGRHPANLIHDDSGLLGDKGKFFYASKPGKKERSEGCSEPNAHATVKPVALMDYLVTLVAPPGGVVLDMFCGSGTTGVSAMRKGMSFIGVDEDETHLKRSQERLLHALSDSSS